eukprot:TRINITY_DN1234_c0_g2_i2.p1 TRINITY_DN1234_c0_g2~~TRINITY_DN1234_c0_g2_i2.p1  ORF type:complete len:335 (-),score=78.68 TRINITY_DN1234_c0_g2_i2:11-1015(-)
MEPEIPSEQKKESHKVKSKAKKIHCEEAKESIPLNNKQKKAKYDRKVTRPSCFENVKMPWSGLQYQPNIQSLKSQFSLEYTDSSTSCIEALANAYSFNENMCLIRNRVRKESQSQMDRKALSRAQFNQAQAFQTISYRPGNAFIQYQNCTGKAIFTQHAAAIFSKRLAQSNQAQIDSVPTAESGNENQFTCRICRRSDAKKYAKDLCQTCYKKQKKLLELGYKEEDLKEHFENGNYFVPIPLPFPQPEIVKVVQPTSIVDSNWICSDCKRNDVKHYAKGRCGACYRKNLNRMKTSLIQGSEKEQTILSNACQTCLLYTSPSPRDLSTSRMPSSA